MSILSKSFKCNFTQVPNEIINDINVSLKAKGLYLYMVSKPDNWEFSLSGMKFQLQESKPAILRIIEDYREDMLADFKDDGYIHIKRTRTKGTIGTGKTNNAIRKVPYAPYILEEVRKIQPKDNIFLFGDIDDASLLRTQWRDACIDAVVPRHKLYATRHTFATLMLQENVLSINELAWLLGHSSPKVTLEHYASIIQAKDIKFKPNFSLYGYKSVTIEKLNGSKPQ